MVLHMNRIAQLRKERGMRQTELADALHSSRQAIGKWETGAIDLSTEMIGKLCAFFGCTADYLLGFSSRRENAVSAAEAELLQAYKDASDRDWKLVDDILAAYKKETPAAAG